MLDHDSAMAVEAATALVNTAPERAGDEALVDGDDLRRFLAAHGISYAPARPTTADLSGIRGLRERLGALFAPGLDEAEVVAGCNAIVADAQAVPRLTRHDGHGWHLHFDPQAPDADLPSALGADLAMGLLVAIRDLGLERWGACAADDCARVFVDVSRNASRRYCDPRACGNRANVAAYRARQRG